MTRRKASLPAVSRLDPQFVVPGGTVWIRGDRLPIDPLPLVSVGEQAVRVVRASAQGLAVTIPDDMSGGRYPVQIHDVAEIEQQLEVGELLATGLHQVDNPAIDHEGNVYVTYSGGRGESVPVSIYRVQPNGAREPFSTIVNPTSLAFDRNGLLYVSSRFEGNVYRVGDDGSAEVFATDLGTACGIAFASDGALYVGDRSGTIFRVTPEKQVSVVATLPASVAAFHLAFNDLGDLFVSAPTLSSYDHVYRIRSSGQVDVFHSGFGRPQGLAVDTKGDLHVAEALAGDSGIFRIRTTGSPERVVSGPALVGVALYARGGMVVASNESVYRLNVDVRGRL